MTSSIEEPHPFFVLTLDERVDLYADVLAIPGKPSSSNREQAADLKRVVFEGLKTAVKQGIPRSSVAIWVDGDLGESVLLRAKAMSIGTSASPGNGLETVKHLFVDYIGIQLSFDPDSPLNTREQLLKQLDVLSGSNREGSIQLIIELDSTPTAAQIDNFGNSMKARANLLLKSIEQFQDAGVNSGLWAFDPKGIESYIPTLAAQAHIDGRQSKVLLSTSNDFLTRNFNELNADEKHITRLAARTHGVDGLLIGPGAYYRQLVDLNKGRIGRDEVVLSIANHLINMSELFQKSRAASPVF